MMLLLAAGIVVSGVGLLAIGFGIPIKDTTFGNSLVLGGATGAVGGLLLIGMAAIVRELRSLGAVLRSGTATVQPRGGQSPAVTTAAAQAEDSIVSEAAPPAQASSWAQEMTARNRPAQAAVPAIVMADPAVQPIEAPAAPAAPERPRRNLLFATRRKEPQPAPAASEETAPGAAAPSNFPAPSVEPKTPFDAAWPARGDARSNPSAPAAAPPAEARPVTAPAANGTTVIKAGVVDGMAYTLYSDGSIEAQMAEGMLRFSSLDDLRNYLEQRP